METGNFGLNTLCPQQGWLSNCIIQNNVDSPYNYQSKSIYQQKIYMHIYASIVSMGYPYTLYFITEIVSSQLYK